MKVIMITWSIDGEKYQKMYKYAEGKQKIRDAHDDEQALRMCRAISTHGRARSEKANCHVGDMEQKVFDTL